MVKKWHVAEMKEWSKEEKKNPKGRCELHPLGMNLKTQLTQDVESDTAAQASS